MIESRQTKPTFHLGGDVLTFILAFSILFYFFSDSLNTSLDWYIILLFFLLWLLLAYWRKIYNMNFNSGLSLEITGYFKAYITLLGIGLVFYALTPFTLNESKITILAVLAFPVISIPINYMFNSLTQKMKVKMHTPKYALVAGIGELAKNVEKQLYAYQGSDYKIKGFINCNKEECMVGAEKVVSPLENIHQYLNDNQVDEIIIALPYKRFKKVKDIVVAADYYGIRIKYIPDYQGLFGKNYKAVRYGSFDAVNVRQMPLDETFSFFLKNSFDILFSFFALLLMLPLFLVFAVLIKLSSPGPIFYCPIRIGKGGKPIRVFKFRSMRENDAVSGGILSTQKDDPRITKIGKIMRKYNLDELPQFFNVLLGDMSVVGPRPHRSYLNRQLQESEDKYMIRHYFKPGITGWAQVNGWRGPTETKEQKSQRTIHDLWYMENWSLLLDIRIIFMTVFNRKGYLNAF